MPAAGKGARQQLCGFLARLLLLLLLVGSAEGRAGPPLGAPPSGRWAAPSGADEAGAKRGGKTTAALAGSACKRIRSEPPQLRIAGSSQSRSEQGISAKGSEVPKRSAKQECLWKETWLAGWQKGALTEKKKLVATRHLPSQAEDLDWPTDSRFGEWERPGQKREIRNPCIGLCELSPRIALGAQTTGWLGGRLVGSRLAEALWKGCC